MLNNIIKTSFAIIGGITGFTLTRTFFSVQKIYSISEGLYLGLYVAVTIVFAVIFYLTGSKTISLILDFLDRFEAFIQRMTLYEIALSAFGLIVGLIAANLVTIPINKVEVIGVPLAIAANILFGCIGIAVAAGKRNENVLELLNGSKTHSKNGKGLVVPKILDTSVIIDGRIVDICRSGFLEGELIVPEFILEELRHIADSSDSLKRNRGRRGLDVLNMLQKDIAFPVRIESVEINDAAEVDDKLLKAAKKLGCNVLTIDYNLSKVASFQGVPVLNINELANAMKPIALPGEEMVVQVIKDGKENGQGIGYLDDGTMIVVDGGRRHMGEAVSVMVTSVLQTAAGRMIFAKPKYTIERVI